MKGWRASSQDEDGHLHVTGCSLIKSVERSALIFPAFFRGTSASDIVSRREADRVRVSAPLPRTSNAYEPEGD